MSAAFQPLADMLKARSGLTLGVDKLYLMETRLAPILKREKLPDLNALASRIRVSAALEQDVVEAMTTNESLFFRDGKPFEALRRTILPRLHASKPPGAPLRIWSAASSTGQEAYSIAMVVAELTAVMPGRAVEIVGTDISREAVNRAKLGLYSQFEIQRGLPMQLLVKHFTKEGTQWALKAAIRDAVLFREWNLLSDLRPLGVFDIVFCRNVLIYFDAPIKRRVLDAIARQLSPGGTLFLGGAETILGLTDAFQTNTGEHGGYTRATAVRPAA